MSPSDNIKEINKLLNLRWKYTICEQEHTIFLKNDKLLICPQIPQHASQHKCFSRNSHVLFNSHLVTLFQKKKKTPHTHTHTHMNFEHEQTTHKLKPKLIELQFQFYAALSRKLKIENRIKLAIWENVKNVKKP